MEAKVLNSITMKDEEDEKDLLALKLSLPSMRGEKSHQAPSPLKTLPHNTSLEDDEWTCLKLRPPSPPDLRLAPPVPSSPPPPSLQGHTNISSPSIFPSFPFPTSVKNAFIPPPFPWATTHRATVHTLEYLLSLGISQISGEVQCKKCEVKAVVDLGLLRNFYEVSSYILRNRDTVGNHAHALLMNPTFPRCPSCTQLNCMRPVVAAKKRAINWLFMLLGQSLGCCTLEQLRYFCKHNKKHRIGSKDHVLYLTYLAICKQLDPRGPFDV